MEFAKTIVASIANYLKIPPCNITFLEMDGMYKDIAGFYVDDKYIINVNTSVVDKFSDMELTSLLIHEMRHAYQHIQVRDSSLSKESKETIKAWKKDIIDYSNATHTPDKYLRQSLEIDAIAFTSFFTSKYFNKNLLIPEIIKEEVSKRIKEIELYYK